MRSSHGRSLILVVDDDPVQRFLASNTLDQGEFTILEAEDGEQALCLFQREKPDLVLLDVVMPGLDGFAVCAALRQQPEGRDVPILMFTSLDDLESTERAYEAGATDFITKPIQWLVLYQRVRYILRASQTLLELRDSEERFRTLVQAAGSVILVLDHQDRVLEFNPAAEKFYLFQRGERVDTDFMALLPRIDDGEKSSQLVGYESTILSLSGSEHTLIWNVSQLVDANGSTTGRVFVGQDITIRRRSEEHIRFLAFYDHLTRLPNRALLQEQLRESIELAKLRSQPLAVLFLDLDQFKRVNDPLGHRVGDLLLQEVAVRLQDCLCSVDYVCAAQADLPIPQDLLARLGGDEFVILLAEAGCPDAVSAVAQRILSAISKPFIIEGKEIFTSCSIGAALYPDDGSDIDTLLKNADAALYHAKNQGRNNHQFYSDWMNSMVVQTIEMEGLLRKALACQELTLHYQPQVNINSGKIVGVEALLRWQNPVLGSVAPAQFIRLAEETGLIVPIGEWVIRTACAQARCWRETGLPPLRMSINLSPRQFVDTDLTTLITQVLRENDLPPDLLELEITESLLMKENVIDTLLALKQLGVRLAIDDFGTGYSNLSYLRQFPIDHLKIDKSFVKDIDGQSSEQAILVAIIAMARSLHLGVIAEGVENEVQLAFLRAASCDEMQGFIFSRPYPAEYITIMLQDHYIPTVGSRRRATTRIEILHEPASPPIYKNLPLVNRSLKKPV